MNIRNPSIPYTVSESIYVKLAYISFFVYLFFVVFGTMMPFQGSLQERGQAGSLNESNILNQLLSLLFLISLISLSGKINTVFTILRREKYLTLLMLWMMISIAWSPEPLISLKRWINLIGELIICLAALIHFRWSEEGLKAFRVILLIYFPLTLLAVALVPEAIQWEFPAWRGLAPTKNNLGQISLFSLLALITIIHYNKGRTINFIHYGLLIMVVIAFFGARSTTSFLVAAFLFSIYGLLKLGSMISNKRVGTYYTVFTIAVGCSLLYITLIQAPEVIAGFFGVFGKDLSFTGRVDLWQAVFEMTKEKMVTGWGIGGFWVMGAKHLYPIYQEFVWLPNQAHQGYLDMLNQTGIVGISLLLFMILGYLVKAPSLKKRNVWIWFFIGILIYNFQESLFFRPRHIGHFLFIFSYLALHTDHIKERGILPVRNI